MDDDVKRTLTEHDHRYEQRFLAQERALDAAMKAVESQRVEVNERYTQRFSAQERAVELALARVDKEFHEHLQQVRTETQYALEAAEKAITKAEVATEKRFESVNEFRAQLNDSQATLMPRAEAEQRMGQNTEKVEALAKRISDSDFLSRTEYQSRHDDLVKQVNELQRLMSGWAGGSAGVKESTQQRQASAGLLIGIAAVLVAAIAIATSIVLAVAR